MATKAQSNTSKAAQSKKESPAREKKANAKEAKEVKEAKSAKAAAAQAAPAPGTPAEGGPDLEELEEQQAEAASASSSNNAAALAAATGAATEMSTSFKNFRHHPDMENFYRFIYENDLRHEALAIIDEIMIEKQKRKQLKMAKAQAH